MIVAVASGKGGTGKTTVSVNLARSMGTGVRLLDCDVEEPNCHLFLKGKTLHERVVTLPVPEVDASQCIACGECGRICEYNAIVTFGAPPLFFPELCHSCGGCMKVCAAGAISEVERRIGVIGTIDAANVKLLFGRLDVGVPMAPPLIRAVKARAQRDDITILDAPPGTSCPVVTTLRDADATILVTEPTPFGLHDLKLAVEMVRELRIQFGVVVNRMGVGDDRVHAFCAEESIPILAEIPDDRRIAEAYSQGRLLIEALPEYRNVFQGLYRKIQLLMEGGTHAGP